MTKIKFEILSALFAAKCLFWEMAEWVMNVDDSANLMIVQEDNFSVPNAHKKSENISTISTVFTWYSVKWGNYRSAGNGVVFLKHANDILCMLNRIKL